MANNYYEFTGELQLAVITPVINALFGPMELAPSSNGAYVAVVPEQTSEHWGAWHDGLAQLCDDLGLDVEDEDEDVRPLLRALGQHFGRLEDVVGIIDDIDNQWSMTNADDLFQLALAFDDGHGLESLSLGGAWYCSKSRLGEQGGHGVYRSRHFAVAFSSHQVDHIGPKVSEALAAGDVAAAAAELRDHVVQLLDGVVDFGLRQAVSAEMLKLMAEASRT